MKRKVIAISILMLATVACSAPEAEVNKEVEKKIPVEVVEEVKAQTPHDLALNNGEKWLVDEGMIVAVDKINGLINKYSSVKLVDYQILGDEIGKQTKNLISSCTMKGQGHEELHKWLVPFMELTEALVMTSSPEAGAVLLSDIKEEMAIYNEFFE